MNQMIATRAVNPTTPPTTPPIIGPKFGLLVLLALSGGSGDAGAVIPGVVTTVTVLMTVLIWPSSSVVKEVDSEVCVSSGGGSE